MSMLPPPVPPVPANEGSNPTGKTLVASAWNALRQDRELIAIPLLGAAAALLAIAPLIIIGLIPEEQGPLSYTMFVLAAFAAGIVSTFFGVALAAGAHARMSGGDPTIKSSLAVAWRRKRGVIGWALLSTTVGLVLRAIEQRFRGAGTLIRLAGDVAWTLASFFALPIIAANDVGPIEALKLSANTFKTRWNSAVRVSLRLGLFGILVGLGVVAAVILTIAAGSASLALGLLVGIVLGSAALVGVLLLSALGAYARVALYRFSAGLPTPGFNQSQLAAAFVPAGRSRRF